MRFLLLSRYIPRPQYKLPFRHRLFSTIPTERITVSILGPPNAGKSTLFNQLMDKYANRSYRLATDKKRLRMNGRLGYSRKSRVTGAIVSPTEGTTRDRRECIGRIGGTYFTLVDTAGIDGFRIKAKKKSMEEAMLRQTLVAAQQSDMIVLIFDARIGLTSDLSIIAKWIRQNAMGSKVVILGNKLEGDRWSADPESLELQALEEAGRLGFGEPIPFSAIHLEGFADLATEIDSLMEEKGIKQEDDIGDDDEKKSPPLQLAILGRPNVGKSTLVNALLGNERCITGPTPGITRDAIATPLSYKGVDNIKIVDTAGIRKISKRDFDDTIEDQSVRDAMRAMKTADVAALVLDAGEGVIHNQELAIMNAVINEGRSLVVVGNKMDLIVHEEYSKEEFRDAVQEQIEIRFPMLRKTPVVVMSSLYGDNVNQLLPVVVNAKKRWERIITTGELNRWLHEVMDTHIDFKYKGKPIKIKYIMQTKGRPPTFLLFCNVDTIPDHFIRFMRKHFQDTFKMYGMEVRLAVKKSAPDNPYKPEMKRSGSGLGGREARKQRLITDLKAFGEKRKRRRTGKQKFHRRK